MSAVATAARREADTLNDKAVPVLRAGRHAEALAAFDAVIRLDAGHAYAWNNRALALEAVGRLEESLASLDQAVALDPGFADAYANRAKTLARLGQVDDALADCDRAITLNPAHAGALLNKSMLLLLQGRLEEGFELFGHRWRALGTRLQPRPGRLWTGGEPLAGRTLLIHPEQGLGDYLQFCRFALTAQAQGARVVLEVPAPLETLLRQLHPDIAVVRSGEPLPPCDLHCPVMTLPRAFRVGLSTLPSAPYLRAESRRVAAWRRRLGQGGRQLKVGLAWSGGHRPDQPEVWDVNERRNIPLVRLAPLKVPGVRFISLQKGAEGEGQLHHLRSMGWSGPVIEDLTVHLHDFADTAALIANLDLVISVDTSTAHLAAAMGKPTWILNRFDTCWRWLTGRDDSPWYPSVRLYRQPAPGAWTPVVERVRADLVRLAHPAQGVRHAIAQVARELQKEDMSPGIGEGLPSGAAAAAGHGPHRQGLAARHI